MKTRETVLLPEDCLYTAEHIWIRPDGDTFLAGVTDFAQDQLGEVAFVDVTAGQRAGAGEEFGSIESVKSVSALFMPVDGEIVECNAALEDRPELVNEDCYGEGWIVRLRADAASDAAALLSAAAYRETLA